MPKLRITKEAKLKARTALKKRNKLPESKKFGITKKVASRLGIFSGVERAKQLIRQTHLDMKDAKRVAAFYQRFRNKKGERAEGAIDLWGGRAFGRQAVAFVKKNK